MKAYYSTFRTKFGKFSIAVDETGALMASAFGALAELKLRRSGIENFIPDESRTVRARTQMMDYLAGKRADFDMPLAPGGTEFQQRVWEALREIPRGETRSYGALAKLLHSSARAVGRANATNPICVLVPCHRAIGMDGSLAGYAFGVETKRRLLALEEVQ
ncbi:methylated-DNA--[protein]-cysteine S-methyltransferase [soil metagenome]